MIVFIAGGALVVYGLARSGECEHLPREDLSLREMADLRHLMDAYKVASAPQLDLTARQASFLVREEFDVPAWLEIKGPTLRVEARLPDGAPERCWNVTYRGAFEVAHGRAYVVPDALRVGQLDLGWWIRAQRLAVPDAIVAAGGPKLTEFFGHLESLHVRDGGMSVTLDDPRWIR